MLKLFLLRRFSSSNLLKNFGWVLSGQILVKFSRLVTTAILARELSIDDYGYVAIILTTTQYLMVVAQSGTKDRIIQCKDNQLNVVAQTSWNIQFLIGVTSFTIQALCAHIISKILGNGELFLPIFIAGIIHLITPFSYVQLAIIQRRCNFKLYSKIDSSVIIVDNFSSALFAVLGLGYWSIVLKGFVCLPLQIILCYRWEKWRPILTFQMNQWRETLFFSLKTLSIDLMRITRESFDYILVGRFLGLQALGLYYFAFNSGLGLSMSIAQPLEKTIYSDFCSKLAVGLKRIDVIKSVRLSLAIMSLIIALQCLLAKFYVPIVFGTKWIQAGALPILILVCLSGITRLPTRSAFLGLRSIGQIDKELSYSFIFTFVFCLIVLIAAQFSVMAVAASVLAIHLVMEPVFIINSLKYFPRR